MLNNGRPLPDLPPDTEPEKVSIGIRMRNTVHPTRPKRLTVGEHDNETSTHAELQKTPWRG